MPGKSAPPITNTPAAGLGSTDQATEPTMAPRLMPNSPTRPASTSGRAASTPKARRASDTDCRKLRASWPVVRARNTCPLGMDGCGLRWNCVGISIHIVTSPSATKRSTKRVSIQTFGAAITGRTRTAAPRLPFAESGTDRWAQIVSLAGHGLRAAEGNLRT